MVRNRLAHAFDIEYHDVQYIDILYVARDYIHKGHMLISHPLSGSVKPNETPFKSIVLSKNSIGMCFKSLSIIEESIACCKKFGLNKKIPESALQDFMEIDCCLIKSAPSRSPQA